MPGSAIPTVLNFLPFLSALDSETQRKVFSSMSLDYPSLERRRLGHTQLINSALEPDMHAGLQAVIRKTSGSALRVVELALRTKGYLETASEDVSLGVPSVVVEIPDIEAGVVRRRRKYRREYDSEEVFGLSIGTSGSSDFKESPRDPTPYSSSDDGSDDPWDYPSYFIPPNSNQKKWEEDWIGRREVKIPVMNKTIKYVSLTTSYPLEFLDLVLLDLVSVKETLVFPITLDCYTSFSPPATFVGRTYTLKLPECWSSNVTPLNLSGWRGNYSSSDRGVPNREYTLRAKLFSNWRGEYSEYDGRELYHYKLFSLCFRVEGQTCPCYHHWPSGTVSVTFSYPCGCKRMNKKDQVLPSWLLPYMGEDLRRVAFVVLPSVRRCYLATYATVRKSRKNVRRIGSRLFMTDGRKGRRNGKERR